MSKFGLDETDVKNIVDVHVENKYGNTLAMVQKNREMIDKPNNQSGWDRTLGSSLRLLNQEIINLKAKVEILEERINNP
jgi:hypothetical protein